jgi:hypothetical protein
VIQITEWPAVLSSKSWKLLIGRPSDALKVGRIEASVCAEDEKAFIRVAKKADFARCPAILWSKKPIWSD